ncbi:MAG TPA: hypothetical protein DCF68_21870 [Cyanothece sp. UBA12306]|nr:hypothetical protein [Cyanothece sp. UBA12306]
MSKLCYPTVDLFIYDLKSPLNLQGKEIEQNRQLFQSRIKDKLKDQAKFIEAEKENSDSGYQALLKPNFLILETEHIKGYFYPVLLNDTYGLLVNCSINEKIEPQAIESSLTTIEQELFKYTHHHEKLTIGKTQILSGWLTEETTNVEIIAKECYKSLVNEPEQWSSNLYGQGKFLNSHIFEIWNPFSDYLDDHLLIILFPDEATFNKAAKEIYFQDWIRLFCYRHKIMWTYHQSRTIKDVLKNYYKEVDTITKKLQLISKNTNNLDQLQARFQEIQFILDKFTRNLLELNILKETIEINLDNYLKLIEILKKKAGEESNFSFLEKFSNLTETKYLKQIDKDEASLKLGLQLLESNINALRSQIELEKSERDRNFQDLVAIIGGGAATITILDFEGKTCERLEKSWPFPQNKANILHCNDFIFNSIITPLLFLLLLVGFAIFLKWIIKKLKF